MSVRVSGPVLDNPVWTSLTGAHSDLGEVGHVRGAWAGRYRPDVCPFGALEDPLSPDCWEALAHVIGGDAVCVLVDAAAVPDGWELIATVPGVQMDGTALQQATDEEAVVLTDADVSEMLELVKRTRPGPYLRHTIRMGRYLGIRRDGELVAMAGERLRPFGWTEISAVCTDASHRAQGLGTRLVRAVAAGIRERSERPFLHAAAANTDAIRLYQGLGFEARATPTFTVLRRR